MNQINIFEEMYSDFKFNKKEITLFESFAGVGSQAMAMKKLAKEYNFTLNTIGISEIDKYAIASYNAIHGETKNYGSICDIQEIPQIDIFTYSFPCQDISLAGKQRGFTKGSGTRSGLLWEVERLLENQHKVNKLPKVLLMENVKALAGTKFIDDFNKWQLKLEELGYHNYWGILNAKDYGIPQNRERVFMVSVLGDYNYTFPKPFELKLRLKDMLEDDVDEKFYLSAKMMKFFQENTKKQKERGNGFEFKPQDGSKIAKAITTNNGSRMDDNFILIPEKTKKGYAEAQDGDGVYINRPHQKRGVVQKGMIQTLKTGQDVGVVVKSVVGSMQKNAFRGNGEISPSLTSAMGTGGGQIPMVELKENDCIDFISSPGYEGKTTNDISKTIVAQQKLAVVIKWKNKEVNLTRYYSNIYQDENGKGYILMPNGDIFRIRKLTPLECWRLMGFSDQDFNKAKSVCSNTQLYKQAGNSIVVDVLYYIFKQLF